MGGDTCSSVLSQLGRGEELSGAAQRMLLVIRSGHGGLHSTSVGRVREFISRLVGAAYESSARIACPRVLPLEERCRNCPRLQIAAAALYAPRAGDEDFTVEARERGFVGQAEGYSKKSAAQKAARGVFEQLTAQPEV
jgi:hypothetical protein